MPCLALAQLSDSVTGPQIFQSVNLNPGDDLPEEEGENIFNRYQGKKIDINLTSEEEMLYSGILNPVQVQEILERRKKSGDFISLYELQTLPSIGVERAKKLLPFLLIKREFKTPVPVNTLMVSFRRELVTRNGYIDKGKGAFYRGSPLSVRTRFVQDYPGLMKIGISAAKDPGEEFFNGSQKKGFDYYSGYLTIQNRWFLEKLVLGDYQLSYGQGLVLWQNYYLAKSADISRIQRIGNGILPHTGFSEAGYNRGIAAALKFKGLKWHVFASSVANDGYPSSHDSLTGRMDGFSGFSYSGLHRSFVEIRNQGNINTYMYGSSIGWKQLLQAVWVKQGFSVPLVTKDPLTGRQIVHDGVENLSCSGSYGFRNMNIYWESAWDRSTFANTAGVLFALPAGINYSINVRNYEPGFQSISGRSFSNGRNPSGEKGVFMTAEYALHRKLRLLFYADWYSTAVSSSVNFPSQGRELMLSCTRMFSKVSSLEMRVRGNITEHNTPGKEKIEKLGELSDKSIRLIYNQETGFKTRLSSIIEKKVTEQESGFLLAEELRTSMSRKISFIARYVIFYTDSYNSRIYLFESDGMYRTSFGQFYGKGQKLALWAAFRPVKGTSLSMGYSITCFNDVDHIGYGPDRTEGPFRSDVSLQMRTSF